jgi:ribosomal protein L24
MVEVGDMVRFVSGMRHGAIGQVLAVDAYESRAGVDYRVLLLTDTDYNRVGTIFPYIEPHEIELYE